MTKALDSIHDWIELAEALRRVRLMIFDFDGVFTDNGVYVFEDGREAVRCNRSDGLGIGRLQKLGVDAMVLSTERNPVVSARCAKLKLTCMQDCPDKGAALAEILTQKKLTPDQAAFMGNDVNDLPCLTAVGLPIIVRDAHPGVIEYARYQTQANGGHGAVREVCDLFEKALHETSQSSR
ncbi:MAG: HAD hydrolase family protein [bacterium]|nr:HAD hydrolase family protein [bacterium]